MTYEEAKKNILNMCCWCNDDTDDTDDTDCIYHEEKRTDLCEKCEFYFALKSIEKQIPKPKHKYMGYRCVCGEEVAKNQDYCEYCGQKLLDWGEKL